MRRESVTSSERETRCRVWPSNVPVVGGKPGGIPRPGAVMQYLDRYVSQYLPIEVEDIKLSGPFFRKIATGDDLPSDVYAWSVGGRSGSCQLLLKVIVPRHDRAPIPHPKRQSVDSRGVKFPRDGPAWAESQQRGGRQCFAWVAQRW